LLLLSLVALSYAVSNVPAYIALKLTGDKLLGRFQALNSTATTLLRENPERFGNHSSSVVHVFRQPEYVLINFLYDEASHQQFVDNILSKAAAALCSQFPRHLAFD
ncbi:hypothetical protein PENTCL1PPCAC_5172, partial [Pristionchus entomophagus]